MKTKMIILFIGFLISSFNLNLHAQDTRENNNSQQKGSIVLASADSFYNYTELPDSCKKNNSDCTKCCKNKKQCRMKDKFIDKDNDGINDNRCKGMGLGCKKRLGKCKGKK